MTRNRRRKAAIRTQQAAHGVPYMVARRLNGESTARPSVGHATAKVEVLPPLSDWTRAKSCQLWADTANHHGPLVALTISRGDQWWKLDDLAREVAGALQDQPDEQRGVWIHVGRYVVTKQEHLDGIAAVLDAAGALSRLTVRSVPNASHCEHASCRRRRGEPPAPRVERSGLDHRGSGVVLGPLLSLAEVMEQHPQLNTFGIGVFDPLRKTAGQRAAELASGREKLAEREAAVLEIAAWLRENVAPIKTPTVGSYSMKHVVERATEYLTNGELIAAALVAGYPVKFVPGPNPLLGMSARDVSRIDTATLSRGPFGGRGPAATDRDDLDD